MKIVDRGKKYWVLVASKDHVFRGVQEGIGQACHGKAYPLRKMKTGDGIVYYSPKMEYSKPILCQEFIAIGEVFGEEVYSFDMGNGFIPYRRDIKYKESHTVKIKPRIQIRSATRGQKLTAAKWCKLKATLNGTQGCQWDTHT